MLGACYVAKHGDELQLDQGELKLQLAFQKGAGWAGFNWTRGN